MAEMLPHFLDLCARATKLTDYFFLLRVLSINVKDYISTKPRGTFSRLEILDILHIKWSVFFAW